MPRIVSFIALVAIVLVMGGLFFHVIAGFLLPLFLALILVVIFRPLYLWMVPKCKGRERVAAALTTVAILLIVLLPLSLIVTFAVVEATAAAANAGRESVLTRLTELRERFQLDLPNPVKQVDATAAAINANLPLDDPEHGPQAVAAKLQRELWNLVAQLPPVAAAPANGEPVAAPVAEDPVVGDWLLEAALARFDAQVAELQALPPRDPAQRRVLLELQDTYYTAVRPRLVEDFTGSRLKTWLVLQANPSRKHLEELRLQAIESLGVDLLGPIALSTGQSVGKFVFGFLLGLVVMIVSVYYFLADGPAMVKSLMHFSPLDRRHLEQLLSQFDRVSRAVVVATLLAAVAQGILAGVGYWLAGFESVFMLMALTMFLAFIPFVGATAVWLPCSVWLLLYDNRPWAALFLALYGVCIVSTVDNLIKPLILHGQSNLHPLLALLSVLGGVRALGPVGVFVGPMAAALLQALLHMLRAEIAALGKTPADAPAESGAAGASADVPSVGL